MPRVWINEEEYSVENDTLISHCLQQAALSLPCGGNGVCGKCKVYVDGSVTPMTRSEKSLLSRQEMEKGIRLACYTRITGDCMVTTIPVDVGNICVAVCDEKKPDIPVRFRFGAVVDIGTTTVAAALYDAGGRCVSTMATTNPQIAYGADVISRVQASMRGRGTELARQIRRCVSDVLRRVADSAHISTKEIDTMVITGNTVMLCLLTETAVDSLATAPFYSKRVFGEYITAAECGLQGVVKDIPVYLPRCLDAFLGADLVCALLSTGMCERSETALLADLGTNGEIALWHKGCLYACSTAAGPAFEGVGISCGMVAAEGAVDRVYVVNQDLHVHVIGGGDARGVCGSGLIDAVACLMDIEEIDFDGKALEEKYRLLDSVSISCADIQALAVSKSAIRSGVETLLHTADITAAEVDHLYLAGGFGNSIHQRNAVRIGLIPGDLEGKISCIGNAALDGAAIHLFRSVTEFEQIPFRKVNLAESPFFADAFIRNMRFQ